MRSVYLASRSVCRRLIYKLRLLVAELQGLTAIERRTYERARSHDGNLPRRHRP